MRRFVHIGFIAALVFASAPSVASPEPISPDAQVTAFADKREFIALLRGGNFVQLDDRLSSLQAAFEAGEGAEDVVENAFLAFANSDPELRRHLDQWVTEMPGSYAAIMARGFYYWHVGWTWRGTGWGKNTHKTRFVKMREFFRLSAVDLGQAIKVNEKLSVAYSILISIAMAGGSDRAAERTILDLGLAAVPGSAAIRYRYLHALWWRGKLDEIKEYVDDIKLLVEKFPGLRALGGYYDFAIGDRFRQRGKYRLAIQNYERALEHGEHWFFRLRQAEVFKRLEQYDAALENYDLAAKARPQMTDVLNWKAAVLHRLDRDEEAFEVWQQALELDPFKPPILLYMSFALKDEERYSEALQALDKAMIYGAFDADVRDTRGRLHLYELKDPENGLDDLKFATELNPKSSKYWYNYGLALYKLDNCNAKKALSNYLQICNENGRCSDYSMKWAGEVIAYQKKFWVCFP